MIPGPKLLKPYDQPCVLVFAPPAPFGSFLPSLVPYFHSDLFIWKSYWGDLHLLVHLPNGHNRVASLGCGVTGSGLTGCVTAPHTLLPATMSLCFPMLLCLMAVLETLKMSAFSSDLKYDSIHKYLNYVKLFISVMKSATPTGCGAWAEQSTEKWKNCNEFAILRQQIQAWLVIDGMI